MNQEQKFHMRDLAASLFHYAVVFGKDSTSFNAAGLQGAVYAWEQFCSRNGLEPDGLPYILVDKSLRMTEQQQYVFDSLSDRDKFIEWYEEKSKTGLAMSVWDIERYKIAKEITDA